MTYPSAYFAGDVLAADGRAHATGDFTKTPQGEPESPERSAWAQEASRIDMGVLERAQRAKYRLLATRAGLRPGSHVLEIGCGWGGIRRGGRAGVRLPGHGPDDLAGTGGLRVANEWPARGSAAFRTRYVADWQLVLERKGETVK